MDVAGMDNSATMLSAVSGSRILGDASDLPFQGDWFGAVAALYMLYHIADPQTVLAEAYRVLQGGGLFVAVTPSRHNDPELADVLPTRPSTFDSEEAPDLVRRFFEDVEVETWDAPMIHLPDLQAIEEYLFGRGMDKGKCTDAAKALGAPLTVTKRGCLVWAYKMANNPDARDDLGNPT